jgi:DNA-binding transcriptional MerR regulator
VETRTLDLEPEFKVKPSVRSGYDSRMKISELADRAGVPVSTVRYYERIGLLPGPERTDAGYRDYDDESATQLLFMVRARGLGISLEQIAELLPAWRGTNCGSARDRVVSLIDEKRAEISARIAELAGFAQKLQEIRDSFDAVPAPASCRTDLSCCLPGTAGALVPVQLLNPLRR